MAQIKVLSSTSPICHQMLLLPKTYGKAAATALGNAGCSKTLTRHIVTTAGLLKLDYDGTKAGPDGPKKGAKFTD